MRVAWFSPLPPVRSGIAAYSAELLPQLRESFAIDSYPESSAHDFVWRNRRDPYDLIVYQLGNATCHDYMWGYLVRYPGLVVLHDAKLHHARARQLLQQNRADDYRSEFRYNHPAANGDFAEYAAIGLGGTIHYLWPMLRVAVETARLVAVHNDYVAETLRAEYAGLAVEPIRMGVAEATAAPDAGAGVRSQLRLPKDAFVFAAFGKVTAEKRIGPIVKALAELVAGGVNAYLMIVGDAGGYGLLDAEAAQHGVGNRIRVVGYVADGAIADYLAAADACLCLRWPTTQETSASWLRCLAAAKATVISDLVHLADVPGEVALRVDLLEEDASLAAAMMMLARDRALRERLARGGHAYWAAQHTLAHMAADYRRILPLAAATQAPTVAALPAHFTDDHSQALRAILGEVGVSVDLND